MNFNFIATDNFSTDDFKSVDAFVNAFPNFQTVWLDSEDQLELFLKIIGIEDYNTSPILNDNFLKLWDLSNAKFPELNEKQYDQFYENWIYKSGRANNFDEFCQLIFLKGVCSTWNNLKYRFVVREK